MPRKVKQVGLPWLKEVPASWGVAKLKFFASTLKGFSISDREKDDYLKQGDDYFPYIMTMDLDKDTQSIKHKSKLFTAKEDSRFNIAPKGSVLTLRMGNCGKRAVLIKKEVTFGDALFAVVPNQQYLNSSFLHYLLFSNPYDYYIDISQDRMIRGIRTTKALDFAFPFPSLQEQEKIAAYLDARIPTISKLIITEKKRIVKHKQLMHALHRKLIFNEDAELIDTIFNGNRQYAESKGFTLSRMKYVFLRRLKEAAKAEDPVLICGSSGKLTIQGNKRTKANIDNIDLFQTVKKGQLLFNGFNINKGAVAIADCDGRSSEVNLILEILDNDKFDLKYFYYFFRATAFLNLYLPFSNSIRNDATDFRSWTRAGVLPVLYPPLDKQKEIADKLDKAVEGIEKEITKAQDLITKLTTLKAALLEEALTGKIDVSNLELSTNSQGSKTTTNIEGIADLEELSSLEIEEELDSDLAVEDLDDYLEEEED